MRYLIATYTKKPDGQVDESIEIDSKYKSRHQTNANVVLDFATRTVLKCRMEGSLGSKDWQRVRDYYYKYYENVVNSLEQQQTTG